MDFEDALTTELVSISGLTDKVFPLVAKGKKKTGNPTPIVVPYLIYKSSEGLEEKSLTGYDLDIKRVDCEINIIHKSYDDMKILTRLVLAKVLSFQSRVIGTGGPYIQNVIYENPVELYEEKPDLNRCVINFEFHFE